MRKNDLLKTFRRGVALGLAFLQIVSSAEVVWAAPEKAFVGVVQQLKASELPSTMGSIEETFKGKKAAQVVIIKDAHAVADAQNSIAHILRYLEDRHNLEWVGAEGASGLFQTELFKTFPDSKLLKKTLDDLTTRGELSGAVLAALTGSDRMVFEGLEDSELYQNQLDAYFRAKQKQSSLEVLLQEFETQIQAAKTQFYSAEARGWDNLLVALTSESLDPNILMQALNQIQKVTPQFKKTHPVLHAAWSEFRQQETTNNEAGMALKACKNEIEQKNPKVTRDATWNQRAQSWMTGEISDTEYAAYLEEAAMRAGFASIPMPIKKLADIGNLMTRVRSPEWVREWQRALQDAGQVFFRSESEKVVAEVSRQFTSLKNAAKLELAPNDWLEMKSAAALVTASQDLSLQELVAEFEPLRDEALDSECAQFYEIAAKRDSSFLQKIEAAARAGKKNIAIVVGGFHALALSDALRKKNISYAVVMPAIQNIGDKEIYAKLMQGDVSWKKFFKIKDGRIQVYESFASAMIHELLNMDVYRKNPEQVLPYFKAWRTELVRRALNPGRFYAALEALNLLDEEVLRSYYGDEFINTKKALGEISPQTDFSQNPTALFKAAAGLMAQAWPVTPLGGLEVSLDVQAQVKEGGSQGSRSEMRVLSAEPGRGKKLDLAKIFKAKQESDGSYSKRVENLQELKKLSDSAQGHGHVLVLHDAQNPQTVTQPQFPLSVRVYPRQVEAPNFEKATELLIERQIRAGRVIEEEGRLKWVPFMKIFENGQTMTYVVYKKGQPQPEIYLGKVPAEVENDAEHIIVLNPARALRPQGSQASASGAFIAGSNVSPPHIENEIPEQMFFWVQSQDSQDPNQRWMVVVNLYPVIPPNLGEGPADQAQALVISHAVAEHDLRFYSPRLMHFVENISDMLLLHAELEGVSPEFKANLSKLAESVSFAVGAIFDNERPDSFNVLIVGKKTNHVVAVNGYAHPDASGAGTANHGHAQHINTYLPIKDIPSNALTSIAKIPVGKIFMDISVMDRDGKTALVLDYGDQRVFVFSRPNHRSDKFDNIFSFMELGGTVVVATISRLFQLSPQEEKSLAESLNPIEWLMNHRDTLIQRGVHPDLLSDTRAAFHRNGRPMTAAPEVMVELAHDLKDLSFLQPFQKGLYGPASRERDPLFQKMVFSPIDAAAFLSPEMERFEWKRRVDGKKLLLSEIFPKGILALVMQFRELAIWGRGAERGQDALRSMRFHAARHDLFNYLNYCFGFQSGNFKPFVDKIEALASLSQEGLQKLESLTDPAQREEQFEQILAVNYEALNLIDQFGEWLAEQALESYLAASNSAQLSWLHGQVLSNRNLRKYISVVLARDKRAQKMDSDVEGMHIYRIQRGNKPWILAINTGVIPTGEKEGSKVTKGSIKASSWQDFLTHVRKKKKQGFGFKMVDVKTGKVVYDDLSADHVVPIEIPEPQGVRLFEVKALTQQNVLPEMRAPAAGFPANELQKAIQSSWKKPESLREILDNLIHKADLIYTQDLMSLPENLREDSVAKRHLSALMTLIVVLDPQLIEKTRDWNPFLYASLKSLIHQNPDLFSNKAQIAFHRPDRESAIVLSRVFGGGADGRNIVFALQFDDKDMDSQDGKVKVIVRDLELELDRSGFYQAQNLLEPNQPIYNWRFSGGQLRRHWDMAIPVRKAYSGPIKQRHPWGVDVYRIIPERPARPKEVPVVPAVPLPEIPELMLAVNLMDLGAELDEEGKVHYSGSLEKLQKLLPYFRSHGFGKIYLYGGLYEMGGISRKLHGEPGDENRIIVDSESFPRTMIKGGYNVKTDGRLADNQGNSFSPVNMLQFNPYLSGTVKGGVLYPGTHEKTHAQLKALTAEAKKLGIDIVTDIIPWLAPEGVTQKSDQAPAGLAITPESVTEDNYEMFFYKELPDNFISDHQFNELSLSSRNSFKALEEDQKQAVMRRLIPREGGIFVKRFGNPGDERIVLFRHMYYEPGVDQAMPNPYHPKTKAYYLLVLEQLMKAGVTEVRVDLAHKLLGEKFSDLFRDWVKDGWQVGQGGEFRPNEEPFEDVIRAAKELAEKMGTSIKFNMEAYDTMGKEHVAVHRKLWRIGADTAYYVLVSQDYRKLASGGLDALFYQFHFQEVLDLKNGKLRGEAVQPIKELIFLSNYDEPSVEQMGGPKRAMWLMLLIMAKAGVPAMMDLRDFLGHLGQFIPIPGTEHFFPTLTERLRRSDFKGLVAEVERAPGSGIAQDFRKLEPSSREIEPRFFDSERTYQFMAVGWPNPEQEKEVSPEWRYVLLNLKPHDDHTIWAEAPPLEGTWKAVDVLTEEEFPIVEEMVNGKSVKRIKGIVMPTGLPYREFKIVPVQRSELRLAEVSGKFLHLTYFARARLRANPGDHVPSVILASNAEAGRLDLPAAKAVIRQMIDGQDAFVEAHPDSELNLGFTMVYDPEIGAEFVLLAEKIQKLKDLHGDRIKNHLRILFTETQLKEEGASKHADEIRATNAQAQVIEMGSGLTLEPTVFAYGLQELKINVPSGVKHLAINMNNFSAAVVFPAALELNMRTAAETQIDAEMLKTIPPDLQNVFGIAGKSWKILDSVLDAKWLEIAASRIILSAA